MKTKLVKKPWGEFRKFTNNEISTVKILNVRENQSLSLQKHKFRKEYWYFLSDGYLKKGNKTLKMKKGDSITIPKNTLHMLFSKKEPVSVLEISFGKFDEKDIIRIKDKYGRVI